MVASKSFMVKAASLAEVEAAAYLVVRVEGQNIALFNQNGKVYAIDNRCPHMGFPLHEGTVKDCILTCHWHHARFDLASGGTFDPWADDAIAFPVEIRDGEIWLDLKPHGDPRARQRQKLADGLEQNISLAIAKAAIAMLDNNGDAVEPFRIGLNFGSRYRQAGWGAGLTMLACMANLLPYLDPEDRPRALYHGLSAVARECANQPPRFAIQPLPPGERDISTLGRWFRQFIEVRDSDGAERCLVSAIRSSATPAQIAAMLFSTVTDHRYLDGGHALDFTNKALEALDIVGWQDAELVLTSLVAGYASAQRMEESNSWRHPIDLVAILDRAFAEIPDALAAGRDRRGSWNSKDELIQILLGEDPQAIAAALLDALRSGCSETELAQAVAYAAALRVARFHLNNDFRDWDTAHHTFTFANAACQALQRSPSPELLRGVFDAAMSVYLDRFLNIPAVKLPAAGSSDNPEALLAELPDLLDRQQQVNAAGKLVANYLYSGGNPNKLLATLGKLLLREDRDFHTIQDLEAAFRQYSLLRHTPAGINVLIAAVRYLAAHAPTARSQEQTYQMAYRLHKGDRLFAAD